LFLNNNCEDYLYDFYDAKLLSMSKKILMILSKSFITDPRVYREAKSLINAGFEVKVVVWDRKSEHIKNENFEGINLLRVHNSFFMKLLPNDLLRNPLWWWKAYKKGLDAYKDGFEFDAVHCHDLDTLAAGILLKRKLGIKLVYDAHEIFGYMIAWDVPKIVMNLVFRLEKFFVKFVDEIITVTEPVKRYFNSVSNKSVTLVMNCKDIISESYLPSNSKVFTLSYIGVIHKRRFFPDLIDLVGNIEKVKLLVAAKKENLKLFNLVKTKAESYDNIEFLGPIPQKDVLDTTLKSDAVICIVDGGHPSTKVGISTKVFEAMVTGRPVIIPKGVHSAEIVEKYNFGIVTEYDKKAISDAIIKLRDNPDLCKKLGKNGLETAKEKFNWSLQEKKLLKLYNHLID